MTFSARHETEAQLLASLRGSSRMKIDSKLEALSQRLESLRQLSSRLVEMQEMVGSEKEQRLLKTITKEVITQEPEKKSRILEVVKGFLPGRKERSTEPQEKKAPVVKQVAHIQKKPFKKK